MAKAVAVSPKTTSHSLTVRLLVMHKQKLALCTYRRPNELKIVFMYCMMLTDQY